MAAEGELEKESLCGGGGYQKLDLLWFVNFPKATSVFVSIFCLVSLNNIDGPSLDWDIENIKYTLSPNTRAQTVD